MTQALSNINNTDSIQTVVLTERTHTDSSVDSKFDGVDTSSVGRFETILDKTLEKQASTLEDIKKGSQNGDMSENFELLQNVLAEAIQEVSMENSLNLTLARDISDIINQIRGTVVASKEDVEVSEDEANFEDTDVFNDSEMFVVSIEKTNDNSEVLNSVNIDSTETNEIKSDKINNKFETLLASAGNDAKLQQNSVFAAEIKDINTEIQNAPQIIKPKLADQLEDTAAESLTLDEEMLQELNVESISADTNTESGDSYMNNSSLQEHSIKVMLSDNNEVFEIKPADNNSLNQNIKTSDVTPEKIIEQITKYFDSIKSLSKLNIVLNPESLGKVDLQLINTKEGLSAQFTVTTNEARELLMKGIDGLKQTLITQGVGVDNISVKVSEPEESSYNQDLTEQENSENGSRNQNSRKQEEKEKGLFEKTIAQSLSDENGNV